MRQRVIILDFGSQYTQLIARRIREANVYCEIHPCTIAAGDLDKLVALSPSALILSGGPSSVYEEGAPTIAPALFELGVPILGICYGMQLFCHLRGGRVERASEREYGPSRLVVQQAEGILGRLGLSTEHDVWMSHGDRVEKLPEGCEVLATSENSPFAAVGDRAKRIYGVQFHPEVVHTKPGQEVLTAFLFEVCGLSANWTPETFVTEAIEKVKAQVGAGTAICGLSGGVDSSVAARICHEAIGERLTSIFVDNGLLRAGERQEVEAAYAAHFRGHLVVVDAAERFLKALAGVTDPEQKRKIIGREFIEVFEAETHRLMAEPLGNEASGQREKATFLVQGTLYPDVIESVSFKGPSAVIKSHHNVGGLPARMNLSLVEPLRELFKDEVRAAGRALGMSPTLLGRQPFPGPGLAIRCLGQVTAERLSVLRKADRILDAEVRAAGLYDQIWQSFCVLLPVRTVGVMGDARTYDEVCAIRAVESTDGMTADWVRLPYDLLAKVSTRIINEVNGINRVVYDVSSKPPATIEWE